ncbi:undecaprenyldiphospho-muramoylpentapeptide beta-N-acetylglucosaminyltransferase [Colwellia sp. 20A7]|uniref:undecaprenyldiphospho-muramoylpentapeptide beta-N-acetylglucosaminyltransferase n=1 Tax=Colwellia sp. 20A7 TaxID=2689569 RepID=UPI001357E9EB|nr:undecaprenyldiphospho-muramoylpentapeptide beta-N-acetylglucosaminyltransferase [Colwellia sp. 20A7]
MKANVSSSVKQTPTLLVMAGGTGGHIFPGLAVAEKLKSEGWNIHWLGTPDRMEAQIVPASGFEISFITISGLRNKNAVAWLKLPFKLINSLLQALRVIRKVKPDVVLGMGGYASAPGGLAAWLMNKPLVVHEQNAAAGLTNRLLARIATKICCAFPNAFKKGIAAQVVGNPLRASIGKNTSKIENEKITKTSHNILVVGGSLGAQVLNEIVPISFEKLVNNRDENSDKNNVKDDIHNEALLPFNIWHQTGKGKQDKVIKSYSQQYLTDGKVKVTEFIDDIASAYQWADIVICRAGALTVSELAMAAKPAILVPLPHAVDDHQTKNAQYLVSRDAGILIKQNELTHESLTKQLNELFSDPQILKQMAESAFAAADADATNKVASICQQLAAA